MKFTHWAAVSLFVLPLSAAKVCDVKALGAHGDGKSNDTAAFQAAVDQCSAGNGGVVHVGAGTYLLTPVALKSHMVLELAKDAVLLASTTLTDFPIVGETMAQNKMVKRPAALLSTLRQTDVTIRGEGTIDGAGEVWWKAFNDQRRTGGGELPRPWLVQFTESDHITVEGVTLKNAAAKALVPYYSTDVTIRNVKIYAPADSPNTDGVSPFSSHRVRIIDTLIDTGSDNILISSTVPLKAGQDSSVSDITVTNCTLLHGKGASIGADTGGGVHGVVLENLHFKGTSIGLRIKAGRGFGGDISDITYRNIDLVDTNQAINISTQYPNVPPEEKDAAQPTSSSTPRIHNLTLTNITATGSKSAGLIVGLPEQPITELTMKNVHISADTGLQIRHATVTMQDSEIAAKSGPALIQEKNAEIAKR